MVQYAAISEKGGRPINEDSLAAREHEGKFLFILADGLGGHGSGEVASKIAVESALQVFDKDAVSVASLLPDAMLLAQQQLLNLQHQQGRTQDLKTTLTLLHIGEGQARWAHIGDSRIYRFSGPKLAERTLDHSVPQMLVNQGEIREREIRFHEDRNRLIRVLGMEWDLPKYELSEGCAVAAPTTFLLCSDGFWEWIDEKEMIRHLKRSDSPHEWLSRMEKIVQQNGQGKNMDNYSAIAVFIR